MFFCYVCSRLNFIRKSSREPIEFFQLSWNTGQSALPYTYSINYTTKAAFTIPVSMHINNKEYSKIIFKYVFYNLLKIALLFAFIRRPANLETSIATYPILFVFPSSAFHVFYFTNSCASLLVLPQRVLERSIWWLTRGQNCSCQGGGCRLKI